MSADFRRLLEEADGDFVARRLLELLEADRGGQSRGAAAHNDHIIFHAVTLDRFLHARREAARRPSDSAPTGDSGQAGTAQARAAARSIMRADRMGLSRDGLCFAPSRAQRKLRTALTAEFVYNRLLHVGTRNQP